jgi:hypothetical protein
VQRALEIEIQRVTEAKEKWQKDRPNDNSIINIQTNAG